MNARVALCLALLFSAGAAFAQSPQAARKGQLLLPEFPTLAEKASEVVNVSFGPELLGFAAGFLNSGDPEQAAAKKIAESLTGVYVRSFTFDSDFAYPKSEIERVRRQLSAPGWTRMVEARSKKESTDVDVFVLIENGKAMGLAIIASEPREFTIVNIVGAIDLEQLHKLQGSFGVPELGIETPQKK